MTVLGLGEAGGRIAADLVGGGCRGARLRPAVAAVPDGVVRADDPASAVAGSSVVLALTTLRRRRAAAESVMPGPADRTRLRRPEHGIAGIEARARGTRGGTPGARFADVALLGPVPRASARLRWHRARARRRSRSCSGRSACRSRWSRTGRRRRGDEAPALGVHEGARRVGDREPRGRRAAGHEEWLEREIAESHRRAVLGGCSRAASGMRSTGRRDGGRVRAPRRSRRRAANRRASAALLRSSRRSAAVRRVGDRVDGDGDRQAGKCARASGRARSSRARTTCTSTSAPTSRGGGSTTSRSRTASPRGARRFALKSHYTSTAERAQVVSTMSRASR